MQPNQDIEPSIQKHMSKMTSPIPGSSLTEDPNMRQAHLSSPEFTVPREAIEYVFINLMEEENHTRLLQALLDENNVLEITQALLFKGFTQGKWNPDLMILLIEPVAHIVMAMSERAGIEYDLDDEDSQNYNAGVMEQAISSLNIKKTDKEPEIIKDLLVEIENSEPIGPSLLEMPEEMSEEVPEEMEEQ
jgi:hypothetical protein